MNEQPKLYVSTTAFRGRSLAEIMELAQKENFGIEFSSGLPYSPDLEQSYLSAKVRRLPHNYFPAPAKPYVMNLASLDESIFHRTMEHCKNGLRLASQTQAAFYSAHAGFCVDPKPTDLGKEFKTEGSFPRERFWNRFISAVRELGDVAQRQGVRFLVENNVVIKRNVTSDGLSLLLCSDADETRSLMNEVNHPAVGVLLDTGHLKVSAETLGFKAADFVDKVGKHIGAIHHSDNNGKSDSNHPVTSEYWFLQHMPKFKSASHILEVHDQSSEQIREQFELLAAAMVEQRYG